MERRASSSREVERREGESRERERKEKEEGELARVLGYVCSLTKRVGVFGGLPDRDSMNA